MARYVKELPMVAARADSFARIQEYLTAQKFQLTQRDGEQVFQKGKGVWVAPGFIKVIYRSTTVRVEAWIDAMGAEQNLEGVVGAAAKKPLKKHVAQVEAILAQPDPYYVPEPAVAQFCTRCGARIEDGIACSECGNPAVLREKPVEVSFRLPEGTTLQEYYKKYAGDSFYHNLKINSIICYVLCGILGLTVFANVFALVDLAIYLGLTLGMHIGKSRGCAIGLLAYAVLGTVLNLLVSGSLGGLAWLAVGISALIIFNNGKKHYQQLMTENH